ncbi:MAG: hypothetical protein ACXW3N_14070 [Rhodoplanes sp.]
MDHFGVADELQRHQADRTADVVFADAVLVPFDRGKHEVIDRAHLPERVGDRLRLRQIETETMHVPADLLHTACARALSRPLMNTCSPRCASVSASLLPMPEVPPMITAVCRSAMSCSDSSCGAGRVPLRLRRCPLGRLS